MCRCLVIVVTALACCTPCRGQELPRTAVAPATDFSQAHLMLDLLAVLAEGGTPSDEALDAVVASPGTDLILHQLNIARAVDRGQYRRMLEGLAEDPAPSIEPLDDGIRARNGVEGLTQIRTVLRWGMAHVDSLRENVGFLAGIDFHQRALARAESLLPRPLSEVPPTFVVIGGRAGAAALESGLYLDPLAMAFTRHRQGRPPLDEAEVVDFFAHEMHHVGAHAAFEARARGLDLDRREALASRFLAALVAEGSATYLISSHRDLDAMRLDPLYAPEFAREDALMDGCADILTRLLDGAIADDAGYAEATAGMLGSGFHVAGSILLAAVDRRAGLDAVIAIIGDPRRLAVEADRGSGERGSAVAFFGPDLASRLATLGE